MEISVVGSDSGLSVSEAAFGRDFNEPLVHQVLTAYLAGARAGTKAQKSRSAVRGGGAKPWRQKGTGRARAGSIRSPLWRSGGTTFAAEPRSHAQKVNRKMYRAAMRSIFSELVRQERLLVAAPIILDQPKTRELAGRLKELGLESVLIVTDRYDRNIELAARNLYRVDVCPVAQLDPVNLVGHERVLVSEAVVRQIEEWLS